MQNPYVVFGATGGQGGAVMTALLERGLPVRAVVRSAGSPRAEDLRRRGVELAQADITVVEQTVRAMSGAAGVFALTTPFEDGPDAELAQGAALVQAAVAAAVPHLVFSSVASADRHTGVPHFDTKATTEAVLKASGLPHTVVGPTYFYDNLLGDLDRLQQGRLELAIPLDEPLQQLSRRDLGRFVTEIFADPARHDGLRIDIASDAPTPREMAEQLTYFVGHPVDACTFDPSRIASPDMRAMFEFLTDTGYSVDIPALHQQYPAVQWQSFADWIAQTVPRDGSVGG